MAAPTETLRMALSPALGGVERIAGRVADPDFPRHAHATYVLGVVERGVNRSLVAGAWHYAGPGQLCAVGAGDAHAGGGEAFSYRCIYPTAAQVTAATGSAVAMALPPVIADGGLARRLRRFFALADADAPSLVQDEALIACLAQLASRHGRRRDAAPDRIDRTARAVERARQLLAAELASPPSLTALAAAVDLEPFRLLRAFRRSEGLPPHAFVVQLRIDRARDLLRAGRPAGEVAVELGFADQAHLTRHFKRRVGVTPGAYARGLRAGAR